MHQRRNASGRCQLHGIRNSHSIGKRYRQRNADSERFRFPNGCTDSHGRRRRVRTSTDHFNLWFSGYRDHERIADLHAHKQRTRTAHDNVDHKVWRFQPDEHLRFRLSDGRKRFLHLHGHIHPDANWHAHGQRNHRGQRLKQPRSGEPIRNRRRLKSQYRILEWSYKI